MFRVADVWEIPALAEAANDPAGQPPGLTIVVTPSWFSITNRVSHLNSIGIRAAALDFRGIVRNGHAVMDDVLRGKIHVLYLYHVGFELFVRKLMRPWANDGRLRIRLTVFEEADRCSTSTIPCAQELSTMLYGKEHSFVYVTDRSEPAVVGKVCRTFHIPETSVFTLPLLLPRNIEIGACGVERNHNKFPALSNLLSGLSGRTFVFTRNQKSSLILADRLRYQGLDATALAKPTVLNVEAVQRGESDLAKALTHDIIVTQSIGIDHSDVRQIFFHSTPTAKELNRRMRTIGRDTDATCTVILSAEEVIETTEGLLSRIASFRTCRDVLAAIFLKDARKLRQGSMVAFSFGDMETRFDITTDTLDRDIYDLLETEEKYIKYAHTCTESFVYHFTPKGRRYFQLPENDAIRRAITQHSSPAGDDGDEIMDLIGVSEALDIDVVDMEERVYEWRQQRLIGGFPHGRIAMYRLERDAPDENEMNRLARAIQSRISKAYHMILKSRLEVVDIFGSERCITAGL